MRDGCNKGWVRSSPQEMTMPAKSQKQARWAEAGCPGSKMSPAKCDEFKPHGKGSMKALPKSAPKRSK